MSLDDFNAGYDGKPPSQISGNHHEWANGARLRGHHVNFDQADRPSGNNYGNSTPSYKPPSRAVWTRGETPKGLTNVPKKNIFYFCLTVVAVYSPFAVPKLIQHYLPDSGAAKTIASLSQTSTPENKSLNTSTAPHLYHPMAAVESAAKEICSTFLAAEADAVTLDRLREASQTFNKATYHGLAEELGHFTTGLPFYKSLKADKKIDITKPNHVNCKHEKVFTRSMDVLYSAHKLSDQEAGQYATLAKIPMQGVTAFSLDVAVRHEDTDHDGKLPDVSCNYAFRADQNSEACWRAESNYKFDAQSDRRIILFSGAKKFVLNP